jgi:hypothetical protein
VREKELGENGNSGGRDHSETGERELNPIRVPEGPGSSCGRARNRDGLSSADESPGRLPEDEEEAAVDVVEVTRRNRSAKE